MSDDISHFHFESVLKIGEQKYILEITFDEMHVLYHFYARPIKTAADFSMLIQAPSEFPALGAKKEESSESLITLNSTAISFDADETATINFDGTDYKLLKLR